ncbi:TonB-dependent siderophore receptor [Methylocystis heyeri]|uniref:TonB-dependent receptor plug domain-containing protein n=1 Tax=Methylocystis heyeri TaxID=391905 RepID=A0A6B8KAA1_9HYPH|nr:TonB-dependent receptor [Methylocystis heyeri]QGM44779.1 TonB-dependent receptor plug domain-containing protein [Methylocystis heyeri]
MLKRDLIGHAGAGALAIFYVGNALAQQSLPPIEIGAPANSGEKPAESSSTQPESGPPVQQTTAGPVRGYQALTARVTRFETPIKELPLSVVVLPRKVIDDQQAISQSEVFRNVSGLQPVSPLFPGGIGPSLRGMRAERYIDGLPNYNDFGVRDLLANVERIEVLKGPASILFQGGASPVGGVVNVVSKLPTADRFAEVGVRGGGYSYASPYIDVNQPLTENKSVLFRLTAQYETTRSNIDVVNRRSYTINPTIKFAPTDATSFVVQGSLSRRDQPDYPGLPAIGAIDTTYYSVRPTAFLSNPGLPTTGTSSSGATVRFDHKFDETFSTSTSARFSSSSLYEPSQIPFGNKPTFYRDSFLSRMIGGPSQFYVADTIMDEQSSELSITSNLMAKFDAGPTRNQILLGGDFNRVWDQGFLSGANATPPDPAIQRLLNLFGLGAYASYYPTLIDFRAPVFPPYVYPFPGQGGYTIFSRIDNNYQNAGATAQIQSTLFERLHILAAGRVAFVDIYSEQSATRPATKFNSSQTAFLPRVGALFDLTNWLSVYGSYAEGLRPVTFFSGLGGAAPKPEGSEQWEAGVKLDGPWGLAGTLAWFDLKRTNVPTTLSGMVTQYQAGEWHSSGVEADLTWQPTASLSFLASYAHIDAKVSKDLNPAIQNAPLNLAPHDSGRLWGNYAFDGLFEGWSFGAGLYAASSQVIEIGGPWSTSGYVTFDSALTFKHENFTFSISGKNLTDHRYFVPYPYLSGRVAPGEGRTFFANLSLRM